METFKAIAKRRSTRAYKPEQLDADTLNDLLIAASLAPIGYGDYARMHLTVIQDEKLLERITQRVADEYETDPNTLFDAPTLVVISSKEPQHPGMDFTDAGLVAGNLVLAATDLNLGTCIVWNPAQILVKDETLRSELDLPEGAVPIIGVALGYPESSLEGFKDWNLNIDVTYVK